MKAKKIIAMLLLFALCLPLASCTAEIPATTGGITETVTTTEPGTEAKPATEEPLEMKLTRMLHQTVVNGLVPHPSDMLRFANNITEDFDQVVAPTRNNLYQEAKYNLGDDGDSPFLYGPMFRERVLEVIEALERPAEQYYYLQQFWRFFGYAENDEYAPVYERIRQRSQGESVLSFGGYKELQEGALVTLGAWEQDGNEKTKDPILWKVLFVKDGKAYLQAVNYIEAMAWNATADPNTEEARYWANSDVRAFLNGSFYETAFTEEERSLLVKMNLNNSAESILYYTAGSQREVYGTGGPDTEDFVYLYSHRDYIGLLGTNVHPVLDQYTEMTRTRWSDYMTLAVKEKFPKERAESGDTLTWYRVGEKWPGPGVAAMNQICVIAPCITITIPQ